MAKGSNTFRLSELTPFSWFYKLMNRRSRGNRAQKAHNCKDKSQISTSEPLKSTTIQHYASNRFSYYIPSKERAEEQLPLCHSHPRKSKKKPKAPPSSSSVLNSLPAPGTSLRRLDDSFDTEFIAEHNLPLPPPPILTKPHLITGRKQSQKQGSVRSPSGTQPIKLKIKSPKLVLKRVARRKGLAESFVVVKSSSDPKEDFRESMVDMIVENSLFSSKELEELLACYLLLNSSEYHDLIVEVFEKIWFDIAEIAM